MLSEDAMAEIRAHAEANRREEDELRTKLSEKDVLIDELDMNFVQNLITAVNESHLDRKTKLELRTTLDHWQNALMLADEIRVTF